MRCLSCNKQLSDKEATRKYASTGTFIDMCNHCFGYVESDIPHVEGNAFKDKETYTEEADDGSDYL